MFCDYSSIYFIKIKHENNYHSTDIYLPTFLKLLPSYHSSARYKVSSITTFGALNELTVRGVDSSIALGALLYKFKEKRST